MPRQHSIRARFGVGDRQWRDWRWQFAHRLTRLEMLRELLPEGAEVPTQEIERHGGGFTPPFAVTPYYLSLATHFDHSDPIIAQCVPHASELVDDGAADELDPLREEAASPLPRLIRKYHDRAVVLSTGVCATYCRHCDRKRLVGDTAGAVNKAELDAIARYLHTHPEVRDVIVSGGDPLTLGDARLDAALRALRSVPSVEVLRLGSRVPAVLPQRVTRSLAQVLKRHAPLYLNTQFNHPAELTSEAAEACGRLADAGISLGNQSVLLKGVNDTPGIMEELSKGLLRMRIRPYYLFQCEPVSGNGRFVADTSGGKAAVSSIGERLGGLAQPVYAVDTADGKQLL